MYMCVYIYIYIYIHTHVHTHILYTTYTRRLLLVLQLLLGAGRVGPQAPLLLQCLGIFNTQLKLFINNNSSNDNIY